MKKTKFFLLPFIFALVVVSCDKENDSAINTVTQETSSTEAIDVNAYEQLTTQYLVSVENDTTPPDLTAPLKFWGKLWGKIKDVLNADGYGMYEAYTDGHEPLGILLAGAFSSVAELFEYVSVDVKGGLPDLQVLADVKNTENQFDLIGFNHYVIVNNVVNDIEQYKAIVNKEERQAVMLERVKREVAILYSTEDIDSEVDALALYKSLKLQPGESYTEGTAYYDRVFSSNGTKADPAFVKILQLYARSYEAVKEGYIDSFVAYSKTMEQAVQEDNNLKTDLKEALLIGMATYRYGIKYYASLN